MGEICNTALESAVKLIDAVTSMTEKKEEKSCTVKIPWAKHSLHMDYLVRKICNLFRKCRLLKMAWGNEATYATKRNVSIIYPLVRRSDCKLLFVIIRKNIFDIIFHSQNLRCSHVNKSVGLDVVSVKWSLYGYISSYKKHTQDDCTFVLLLCQVV